MFYGKSVCNFPRLWVILCVVATWMLEFPQEIHMVDSDVWKNARKHQLIFFTVHLLFLVISKVTKIGKYVLWWYIFVFLVCSIATERYTGPLSSKTLNKPCCVIHTSNQNPLITILCMLAQLMIFVHTQHACYILVQWRWSCFLSLCSIVRGSYSKCNTSLRFQKSKKVISYCFLIESIAITDSYLRFYTLW